MLTADGDSAAPPAQIVSDQGARPLPDELVVSILEFLGLVDLRAAAAVSRQLYRSAWRAGLYIERTYSYDDDDKDPGSEVQTWTELVDHALRKQLRLALTFKYLMFNGPPADRSTLTQILRAISRSLPVLVALSITVRYTMFKDVYVALQHPAPRLRSLRLSRARKQPGEGTEIPTGLFSGDAPQLCELALGCLIDDTRAIPAFANVVRLETDSDSSMDNRRLSLGFYFPKLAHLYVHFNGQGPHVPPPHLDLTGVTLRTLVFKDTRMYALAAAKEKSLRGRHVPVVHHLLHLATNLDWRCPLGWTDGGGTIHARLNVVELGLTILVASADLSWRRSYTFHICDLGSELPLADMPGLCARLAYIRMHSEATVAFLQCAGEYTALARVRVDIAPALDDPVPLFRRIARERLECEAGPRLRCPLLSVVALCAPSSPTLTVGFRDIAFLCHALGAAAQPALELCGVTVEYGRGEALCDLFSHISCLPDAETMPCAHFDGGIWDDHAAILSDTFIRMSLPR